MHVDRSEYVCKFIYIYIYEFICTHTFGEINVSDFVGRSSRVVEIFNQFLNGRIARRYQINCLHSWQGFTFLVYIFYEGDPLGTDIMHLTTCRDHSHRQLINDKDPPFYSSCCLLFLLDHLVHNFCERRGNEMK